jgi:hypothetical protein
MSSGRGRLPRVAGLSTTLELEATTYGRRLVDRASRAVLPLSDLEAKLVQQWNGAATAVQLSAQLFAQGVDVEAAQVAAFFRRLSRIGLLAVPPPGDTGLVPPSPGIEGPADAVPRFRTDLLVDPAPEARGVFQVTDPLTSRTFSLYDYELSVARMLDGRRKARDLLAAADVIGVTLSLAALKAFLRQLKAWRFLETAAAASSTTWQPRRAWTDEVRELYQQALRLARRGQTHEAISCLESVLEVDPENEEAPALMARLSSAERGEQALGVGFESLHGDGPPRAALKAALKPDYPLAKGDPFDALEPVTDPALRPPGRHSSGPTLWPTTGPLPLPATPAMAATLEEDADRGEAAADEERERTEQGRPEPQDLHAEVEAEAEDRAAALPSRRRGPVVLVLAGVVLLGVVGGLFFPVAATQELACRLEVVQLGEVRLVREGAVSFQVASGVSVKAGEVLGTATPRPDPKAVAALEATLQGLQAQAKAKELAEGPVAKAQAARRALASAQAAEEALLKQRAKLEAQKGAAARKRLQAVEKALKPKQLAVERARATLEAVTHAEARAALEARVDSAQQALAAEQGGGPPQALAAPVAGVLLLSVDPTGLASAGAVVGRVVAPALKVTLGEGAAPEGPVEVRVGGVLQQTREGPGGRWVEGSPALVAKPCTATSSAGRRPFVLTLL